MEERKLNWQTILKIVATVLSVISVFMLFLPAMSVTIAEGIVEGKEVALYNGFALVFGYQKDGVSELGFSGLNFLSFVLIVLGVVACVLDIAKVRILGKKSSVILCIVAGSMLVVGGILATFAVEFAVTVSGNWSLLIKNLTYGPVMQGIVAIVAGVCAMVPAIIEIKNSK